MFSRVFYYFVNLLWFKRILKIQCVYFSFAIQYLLLFIFLWFKLVFSVFKTIFFIQLYHHGFLLSSVYYGQISVLFITFAHYAKPFLIDYGIEEQQMYKKYIRQGEVSHIVTKIYDQRRKSLTAPLQDREKWNFYIGLLYLR